MAVLSSKIQSVIEAVALSFTRAIAPPCGASVLFSSSDLFCLKVEFLKCALFVSFNLLPPIIKTAPPFLAVLSENAQFSNIGSACSM